MPFDPGATPASAGDFPGTGTNRAALYQLSTDMDAVPVRLKKDVQMAPIPDDPSGAQADKNLTSYGGALSRFAKMDPDVRAFYQQAMFEAGVYKRTDTYIPGDYDDSSASAWAQVVDTAAKEEKSIAEVLEEKKKMVLNAGGTDVFYKKQGAAAQSPLVTKVTNPDDLRLTAQQVATKTMGRAFTEDELTRFISAYQGQETASQAAQHSAAAGGGRVVSEASPEAAATAFAQQAHPTEFAAHKQVQVFDKIRQMLGGTISAAKPGSGGGTTGV